MKSVNIIGAGLAGCEAAWQLAQRGVKVELFEMRGVENTPAHKTDDLAELVCSNSFRSDDIKSAVGILHQEMRCLQSLIMQAADDSKVPAGSALAVDRNVFSKTVEQHITNHPNINLVRKRVDIIPEGNTIIASGPLTSDILANNILKSSNSTDFLSFFDAISPIVYKNSINFDITWFQSRYDKGGGKDYINCPLTEEQYYSFVHHLVASEKIEFKQWEKNTPYFNGCLPIEIMAERGKDTLRFGPMKPVGLVNPKTGNRPFAVVQLRQDNKDGSLYNIVGFQTKMKYDEQKRVLKMIPGLKNAEFARLGGIHRNTFINSPKVLNANLSLKNNPVLKFAGQITGVEGYVESAAIALLSGIYLAYELKEAPTPFISRDTALGSLVNYIVNEADSSNFQPMNINFGLFPEIHVKKGEDKKGLLSDRALASLQKWKNTYSIAA
ncbi:methylenetetrahydrofolate--tRNA-(uracil(54)-C(5))-methyltransferase (FADH(2)-oxidizing) TrmFO [Candidatus Bandiella euplotis]|uniref:Methylenetetrahydrofolate--tRNA-(uracil-5-)-methyltransferase TrmFO n=1 Tax=Candidatus Bandiella euplotis TaxID=1664265 RepID=A0ABZ0UJJ5_9RICK|nr:methylenetetrahydrofolate--tRNA-(uracil(54)-C(5))-methyltransferase (FADH(2)-oxidizing) TrmFO [Candidatus Bandiella woodruffii]WPX96281.1 Methylenetetrahydrofolate--tRNA-(uracil-5-)-methyltransferase TrmFO [Candidatus Bandiella woodruffii]